MNLLAAICLALLLQVDESPRPQSAQAIADLRQAILARNFTAVDDAIRSFAPLPDAAAAAAVQPLLSHPDAGVRRMAGYALSQVNLEAARQAISALVEALKDGEPRVRARVAFALGQIGPPAREAVPALCESIKDENPRVRAGSAHALGLIGVDARVAIPLLVEASKDEHMPVCALAVQALGRMGPAAKEALPALRILQSADHDAEVRAAATTAIDAIDPSIPSLIAALADPDSDRRYWAVGSLVSKGPEAREAIPRLIEVLRKDDDARVRAGAELALAKLGPAAHDAGPALIEALKDRVPRVRAGAAHALGLIGPSVPGSAAALAEAMRDVEAEVCATAATSLSNLGPAAEAAVPVLIALIKARQDPARHCAFDVLGRIGAGARGVTAALLEVLRDRDPALRREAMRALVSTVPQAAAPVSALVEAFQYRDAEGDHVVRAWACLSLAEVGPAAHDAVAPLITTLQDDNANVRAAGALALGKIGPAAVPALVKALDHVDGRARAGAARALGIVGPAARRALPALCETLKDEDTDVCVAAASALGRIAAGFQMMQDPNALAALDDIRKALATQRRVNLSTAQAAEWQTSVACVQEAIRALKTVERAHLFERLLHSPWFLGSAGFGTYALALLTLWCLLLWRRPLTLLVINDALRAIPHLRLPSLLGGVEISLRAVLLVGYFHYHPRVLDAWISLCLAAYRANFQEKRTVKDRTVYVPMPVVLDGQVVPTVVPQQLGKAFGIQRGCLLICGEGGAGKTSLACRIGHWAMAADRAERLCQHVMLPVLIEHELDLRVEDGKQTFTALTEAVRGQLQALIGARAPLSQGLLEQLLRQRRILVIVDHFSELSAAARATIRPGHADFPIHALVVTSRREEALDGVPQKVVEPLRIEGNRLSSFMEAYLVQRGKRHLFDDPEYFEACRRLSLLAGGREVTVLLAKLYAEQLIARKESGPDDALPTNLPDLMLGYVNELNRTVADRQRRSEFEVQRDVRSLAWECLRQSFHPESVSVEAALEALGGSDAAARLEYLAESLKLIRIAEPARDRVSFTLDPLAEHLAAAQLVSRGRANPDVWREFLAKVNHLRAVQVTSPGFLRAVRDCCLARKVGADLLGPLDEQIARAA